MYEPILSDFIGLGPFRFGSIFLFMFGALIPLSRMYLGLHSTDQILVGLCLSFCFTVLYRFFVQKLLFHYVYECAFGKRYKDSIRIMTVFLNLALFAVPIILYFVNTTESPISPEIVNVMNKRC